jgi:hypothetical protein
MAEGRGARGALRKHRARPAGPGRTARATARVAAARRAARGGSAVPGRRCRYSETHLCDGRRAFGPIPPVWPPRFCPRGADLAPAERR